MARRRLLGNDLWARHLEPSADEREIARFYTLGPDELAQIMARRSDANRLGYALVLLYLRHPGRVLDVGEAPPDSVVAYVARQLGAPVSALNDYARRGATRRAHLAEAMGASGYSMFDRAAAREAVSFLTATAQTIVRPGQLAGILVEELRRRHVLLPSALVLEAVIRATPRMSQGQSRACTRTSPLYGSRAACCSAPQPCPGPLFWGHTGSGRGWLHPTTTHTPSLAAKRAVLASSSSMAVQSTSRHDFTCDFT